MSSTRWGVKMCVGCLSSPSYKRLLHVLSNAPPRAGLVRCVFPRSRSAPARQHRRRGCSWMRQRAQCLCLVTLDGRFANTDVWSVPTSRACSSAQEGSSQSTRPGVVDEVGVYAHQAASSKTHGIRKYAFFSTSSSRSRACQSQEAYKRQCDIRKLRTRLRHLAEKSGRKGFETAMCSVRSRNRKCLLSAKQRRINSVAVPLCFRAAPAPLGLILEIYSPLQTIITQYPAVEFSTNIALKQHLSTLRFFFHFNSPFSRRSPSSSRICISPSTRRLWSYTKLGKIQNFSRHRVVIRSRILPLRQRGVRVWRAVEFGRAQEGRADGSVAQAYLQ
jgi:hypothetical protein